MFEKVKTFWGNITGKNSLQQQWLKGEVDGPRNGAVMTNAMTQSASVYACIRKLAESVSSTPLEFYQGPWEPNKKPLTSGPVVELFARPNPQLDGTTFVDLAVEWLHYSGETFIAGTDDQQNLIPVGRRALRGVVSPIRELHVLPSYRFREVIFANRGGGYDLDHWIYSGSSFDSAIRFCQILPRDILHSKLGNPFWQWRGLSPLQAANLDASMDYAAGVFQKGMMMDNAEQGLIVTMDTDDPISDEQREQIRATLRNRKNASNSGDRYTIIGGKNVKIEKPSLSSADAQLLENRNFGRRGICACLDVPEQMIGIWDASNRSTSVTIRREFFQNRIYPLIKRVERTIIQPVVDAIDPSITSHFAIEQLPTYQEVMGERAKSAAVMIQVGMPLNDAIKLFNIDSPPVEGGDKPMMHAIAGTPPQISSQGKPNADQNQNPTGPKNEVNAFSRLAEVLENKRLQTDNDNGIRKVNGKVGKQAIELRGDLMEALEGNVEMQDRVKKFMTENFKA